MNHYDKSKALRLAIGIAVATLISFILFYIYLPPINPCSKSFWLFLTAVLAIYGLAIGVFNINWSFFIRRRSGTVRRSKTETPTQKGLRDYITHTRFARIYAILIPVPIAVLILGSVFSSTVFNARKYASVIDVNEEVFEVDMPEVNQVTNIALLDTPSAVKLGTKTLGGLYEVVSQFVVSDDYTQINYKGDPTKVANLEYAGFFKWLNNKDEGIPGYIMVDAVNFTARYCELGDNMVYAESAYFGKDLQRALRFRYPTKIFDNISFEVDEDGKVYYIVSCASPRVGLFGAMDISEVIIFNPVDGSSEIMSVDDVPKWIDIVYDGYLACEKYDWQGIYSGGFFNSIIGQKSCKQTTDDFGYLMLDDDVWYFTGVTSVTSDESNIGFILSCARTGEYKFYSVIGAEEYSAMGAAEGEVQEKGYDASFPALVNIAGEPTYIMVLKDANSLVKLYALVNVEQYNFVVTGETQSEAITAYLRLLAQNGVDTSGSSSALETVTVKVVSIDYLSLSGVSYAYIRAEDGRIYRVEFNEKNERIIFVKDGDSLVLEAILDEESGIYAVETWSREE